ncbi:acetyl-CoA C-acyltransferase [Marinicella sp. S1101]|uniref:acetyl-CoA C-acyltransferase n=1 Tax=Marinicella marina TaxID=2996016 RepID=UPI002260F40B|nr:acetyl-CoA C-acyltransferase [Marinicella marina]MCX7553788.1 acetyl-CoA C-acyltransferase [Marinicella marina]MDJ1140863.1 acetyl-CoA C-acyltransferase [Marinicella marina]
MKPVYIVEAVRTPIGKAPRGMFNKTRPDDLLARCLTEIIGRNPTFDPQSIGDVVIGCAMPEAEQGMNVARIAALLAGLPESVPAMTINRFCSSGIQAVAIAAQQIATGQMDAAIAGGTESMSMVPMMGHKIAMNPAVFAEDSDDVAIAYGMGITAEKVAEQWEVSRQAQDEFAVESHKRAINAIKNGYFDDEIVPIEVTSKQPDLANAGNTVTTRVVDTDEGPRPGSTPETLAKLRPVFRMGGSVTAANSSQMSDGAGALLLCNEEVLKRDNLTPIAMFHGFSVAGVPPEIMGIGPIKAIPKVLSLTGIKQDDLDWIELNEAFAAQSLAVIGELGLDTEKVNPNGGAIALGHPLGATGACRAATAIHGLRRTGGKYGMVTMCIGTGMGAAGVIEAL